MEIFANACEPHSWLKYILDEGTDYAVSNLGFFESGLMNPGLLKQKLPSNPITVDVTGHSVFSKLFIQFIRMHRSYYQDGDYRQFIKILNSSGVLLVSIGYNGTSNTTDAQPLAVYSYNADGSQKTKVVETALYRPLAVDYDYGSKNPDRALSFQYTNDPNDSTLSKFDVYYGTELIATMSGSELGEHVDADPAKIVFFSTVANLSGAETYKHLLSYIIVTDELDFSLEPRILRPSSLITTGEFTGTVSALAEILQDDVYMSCSAESDQYIEFTLASSSIYGTNSANNSVAIESSFISYFGRYLEIGAESATFEITLYNGSEIFYSEDVVVAANEDSSYYKTKVLESINSGLLGTEFSVLKTFTVRISLKAV